MKRPRVLLADDHRLLREAFAQLLAADCDVVGAVADGAALLAVVGDLRPDVVVLDVAMPLLNGLDAARRLKHDMPEVKIIFLTMSEDPDVAEEALRIGASGYLLKNSAASELHKAIREVCRGRTYVTPLAGVGAADARRPGGRPGAYARRAEQAPVRGVAAAGPGILDETDRPRAENQAADRGLSQVQHDAGIWGRVQRRTGPVRGAARSHFPIAPSPPGRPACHFCQLPPASPRDYPSQS